MGKYWLKLVSIFLGFLEYIVPNYPSLRYRSPVFVIIFINIVPMVGILFLGWKAWFIIFAYWAENVILWFYHIFKIFIFSLGQAYSEWKKSAATALLVVFASIFFTIIFTFLFGGFIFTLGVFVVYVCLMGLNLETNINPEANFGYAQMMDNINSVEGIDGILEYIYNFMAIFLPDKDAAILEIINGEFFYLFLLFLGHSYSFFRYFILGFGYKNPKLDLGNPFRRFWRILIGIVLFFSSLFLLNIWFEFSILAYQITVIFMLFIKMLLDINGHFNEYEAES